MTLAIILVLGIVGVSPAIGQTAPSAQTQSTPDQQSNSAQAAKGKSANTPPPSTHAPTSKKAGKSPTKSSVNCDSAANRNTATKGSKANNPTKTAAKNSAAVSPCAPKKVIVRQGSTTEPSIEVVGGAGGRQASDERNTAIQMLETAEANLKKMEGTQLSSDQQDMLKQVRDFMDQSRAATSAGDLDQARTLAWKAQLLSEELVRTGK